MIVLIRVDERLIHGQVVLGWGTRLRIDRYVVADDELAVSDWEQDIYRLGAGGVEVVFSTVSRTREQLEGWREDRTRTALLTRDVASMREVARDGVLSGCEVNLGGLYHRPGRNRRLSYVHLSESEAACLLELENSSVRIEARDLPESAPVGLAALLS